VIFVDGKSLKRSIHPKLFISPGGLMAIGLFLRFRALRCGAIVSCAFMPYTTQRGASHDFVEQGFHDQDAGADHSCTDRRNHYEGGKSALRL
jgi:hypothetical protein